MRTFFALLLWLTSYPLWSAAQPRQILLNDHWKAKCVQDEVADGTQITSPKFQPVGWMEAVVPGTVLTTLLHNQLVPDPFFGLSNTKIPDIWETGRDHYTYWFYREFELPQPQSGQQIWLTFRGINYFAEIFLNGKRVNTNTHQGMYLREKYLITEFLLPGKTNKLAVRVAPPDPAGNPNNGQGGDGTIARNITMQCTAGWDWICSIPDRNTGIWDQVALEITNSVDLKNPYIETRVPGIRTPGTSQQSAYLKATTELKNASGETVHGTASAEIDGQKVTSEVTLAPNEEKILSFREIEIRNPRLWWPNGMGEQPLYPVRISFTSSDGVLSDTETIPTGIRETGHTFDPVLRAQIFSVNGQKIFIKGGNWIASDALLRLSPERYEAEVRLHAGMNMNMIRVWGGGLTERPEFYDACDKFGILVWQDLWVSGDCNGEWGDGSKKDSQERRKAYPDDHALFLTSVADQVKMLRNHPSLFLWCGGNETYPPVDILSALEKEIFPTLDPKRFFLNKSTSPNLMTNEKGGTGDGPYGILEPEEMFLKRSFPFNPEIGSVGIPNYDGLKKIIPAEEMQVPKSPPGSGSWAYHKYHSLHDFPDRYGKVKDAEDYCRKAQIVTYEQYRALQEAFNYKMWEWYTGMLVWKNQNPWTALRGSFYDYYLDYQGGYFGYRHGAASMHIQLNLNDSAVCVVNQTSRKLEKAIAVIRLFDLHGKLLSEQKDPFSLEAQQMLLVGKMKLPKMANSVFFLRLQLLDEKGKELDENFYWLTSKAKSYEALNELAPVNLEVTAEKSDDGSYSTTIANPGNETAFFIRLKVVDEKGELVLPLFLDENFFTLLPGESRKVKADLKSAVQPSSGKLFLVSEGWNSGTTKTNL
jgi:hypothetical protein